MPNDRDPQHLFADFRVQYNAVLNDMNAHLAAHHPGFTAKMIEGFRTQAYQQELYAQGRTKPGKIVTYRDGVTNRSNHQSSLASDVGIFKGAEYIEEPAQDIVDYYGHCVRAHDLKWGGDWHTPDQPHAEWPEDDAATYEKAREWQSENGLR